MSINGQYRGVYSQPQQENSDLIREYFPSGNSARAAAFAPAGAEQETFSYRVTTTTASNTPVVLNELMASNAGTLADPQGEFDDWIELQNVTDQAVAPAGRYLSD